MTKAYLLNIALTLLMTVVLGEDNIHVQERQHEDITEVLGQDNLHLQERHNHEAVTDDTNFKDEMRSAADLMLLGSANSRTLQCIEKSNKKMNCTARGGTCMETCPEEKAKRLCKQGCSCCLPCTDKNKCLNNGGTCQAKHMTCEGEKVDAYCKGGCTCCLPIATVIECNNKGGFCAAKTGNYCDGEFSILQNSCNDQCSCCVPDPLCESPWVALGNSGCFLFVDVGTSWDDAREYCRSNDGDLAILDVMSKLIDIFNYMESAGLSWSQPWVGATSRTGSWRWLDGNIVTDGWADGYPTANVLYKCVYLEVTSPNDTHVILYNFECVDDSEGFLCEK